MTEFTVAIPTFNGASRIIQVLDRLRSQQDIESLQWTVIVVDNNSTDNIAEVLETYNSQHPLPYDLIHIIEKQQGAAFARQKAIQVASSNWVGFLDDDVLPAPHWVAKAIEFAQQATNIAVFGGQIHGDFEVSPPENFGRIQSFLAIRERGNSPHQYDPVQLILPPSAAWVVHRQAWLAAVPPCPTLSGRVKGSMVQGDDYEPLLYLHQAGWEIWYNPTMHVHHHIPSWRLERDYLMALSRGCGLCICSLRMMNTSLWQKPIVFAKITMGSLKRLCRHWIQYRKQTKFDLVLACERAFFTSSFLSSFYFVWNKIMPKQHQLSATKKSY
ncbi:hormogonium polysaccharide biosynthesis glycosyltransferase HpsE [Leptolyngbya sp. PCC 6406]|uniref:hormogonium polysaccharide biosynthesis glycosyltransferase HpsE n=1 Tax=Leptolyngbya sp. PCC 6406 TaxID=1173264 RepID=UPI0002AC24C3|nr:hormogonium polysaccharide biosynthesis glycosyltransferase HpsE [Leptolyngbya sp. PCC 6406]